MICALGMFLGGCLETDNFDGLTDNRPEIAVTFPGRSFDQDIGLAYISSGFNSGNATVTVTAELEGGSANIANIISVEASGGLIAAGACNSFQVLEENVAASGRSFSYAMTLDELTNSDATCTATILAPDVYWDLIFTLEMDNGAQIVSQQVRVAFTE